uniref:BED-type domain-containing protein n=1 Tax=Panagrolaimus superbus TaxID=310955 RepID=A0A914YXP0_9BILA
MNPRLPSEFLELFKDQQQNLNTLNPLLFNNEIARLFIQQKLAQMAAASQGNRSDASSNNNSISTPALVEAAAAVAGNKRLLSESHRYHPEGEEEKPRKRSRIGGQSVKTAEVWRYFEQIPNEQAAKCSICSKTIKATNSSTTGMIRHLRSCHHPEHEILQIARQQNSLRKVLKSGVIDGEHLNEMVLIQQLQQQQNQEKESAAASADNDRISETVESIAASTSSNASESDVQIKGLHTIERLISTPKQQENNLEHDETFGSTPISKPAKRGRPPKITLEDSMPNESGFVQNKLCNELSILFAFKVLPVEIMDNQLFQSFLRQIAPGYPLASAEEFRTKILPNYSQAFLKNNNSLKTPIHSSKTSRVHSDGKTAASPAPTNESGFHEEDESHPADQSSVADSLLSFLCASVNGTPTSQHNTETKSESYHGFCETDSVISDKSSESSDQFENMFDELLDHIGHGVFPKENLHMLVVRSYNAYATIKSNATLIHKLFKLLGVPSESNLDEVVRSREANDSGLDMNASGDKMFPRLWNCIVFAVNCFNEINTLIEKDLLTVQRFNDADYELLTALHHNIINPEN